MKKTLTSGKNGKTLAVNIGRTFPRGKRNGREKNESKGMANLDEINFSCRKNAKAARALWGNLPRTVLNALRDLGYRYSLSIIAGDLQLLHGGWYVTYGGLLRMATRCKCSAITTAIDRGASDPSRNRWVFKAVVYKNTTSRGFVGFGDADPSNVSAVVQGAELRIAETRAVNRALRKAYGIGICSVEELGSSRAIDSPPDRTQKNQPHHPNGSNNGQPRLRDQLCILIRQHNLDPALVKFYAADFCGTATLSGASRELVESFIAHLSTAAIENRDSLVGKLNSYAPSVETRP